MFYCSDTRLANYYIFVPLRSCYNLTMRLDFDSFIKIFLFIIFIPMSVHCQGRGIPLKGTLIVAVSCKNGVIMGSDARGTINGSSEYYDDIQKIKPIMCHKLSRPCGMYGVTNIGAIVDRNDNSPISTRKRLFDVDYAMDQFFLEHDARDIEKDIEQLKSFLNKYTTENFFPNIDISLANEYMNKKRALYSVILFTINQSNTITGYILNTHLKSTYDPLNNNTLLTIDIEDKKAPWYFYKYIQPLNAGETDFSNEVCYQTGSEYDAIRKIPEIDLVLRLKSKASSSKCLSKGDAIKFIKKIVEITYEQNPMGSVSKKSECSILIPGRSFKWKWVTPRISKESKIN